MRLLVLTRLEGPDEAELLEAFGLDIFLHAYNETLWNDQVLKESEAYRTIEAVKHCERSLLAGFTTLRDLGTEGAGFADVALQRAVNEGLVPGPRLFVATRAIVATASYGPGPLGFAARAPDECGDRMRIDVPYPPRRRSCGHRNDFIPGGDDRRPRPSVYGDLRDAEPRWMIAGGSIEVRGWCENGSAPRRVKCAVTNSGSAIPAGDLPRVFDRFFRGDRARRTAAGSGLGLAITKQLVELNAGTVEASNCDSGGVTFTLSLPG